MIRKLLTCGALCGTLLVSGAVIAEGPFKKPIEARQAMFKLISFNTGLLGDMAKGDTEYDAVIAAEAAKNLNAAANLGQGAMWPAGSDKSASENETRALPEIWESLPDFESKLQNLRDAAAGLETEAGNGLDALKSSMGDVGKTCKACHDEYRGKRT